MALKVRLFGKHKRNPRKFLKYCAGEEWRRSAGLFVWDVKNCCTE
jgi:hypothetical protein